MNVLHPFKISEWWYYTISFKPFNAFTLTTLRAGFALKVISSPVKGLRPLRDFVAGLWIIFWLTEISTKNIIIKKHGKKIRYFTANTS